MNENDGVRVRDSRTHFAGHMCVCTAIVRCICPEGT